MPKNSSRTDNNQNPAHDGDELDPRSKSLAAVTKYIGAYQKYVLHRPKPQGDIDKATAWDMNKTICSLYARKSHAVGRKTLFR
jgi:hypothetical protein